MASAASRRALGRIGLSRSWGLGLVNRNGWIFSWLSRVQTERLRSTSHNSGPAPWVRVRHGSAIRPLLIQPRGGYRSVETGLGHSAVTATRKGSVCAAAQEKSRVVISAFGRGLIQVNRYRRFV